jgi:hypothetical protein
MATSCSELIKSLDPQTQAAIVEAQGDVDAIRKIINGREKQLASTEITVKNQLEAKGPRVLQQVEAKVKDVLKPSEDSKFKTHYERNTRNELNNPDFREETDTDEGEIAQVDLDQILRLLNKHITSNEVNSALVRAAEKKVQAAKQAYEEGQKKGIDDEKFIEGYNAMLQDIRKQLLGAYQKVLKVEREQSKNQELLNKAESKIADYMEKPESYAFGEVLNSLVYTIPESDVQFQERDNLVGALLAEAEGTSNYDALTVTAFNEVINYLNKFGTDERFGVSPDALYLMNRLDKDYFSQQKANLHKKGNKLLENLSTDFKPKTGSDILTRKKKKASSLLGLFPGVDKALGIPTILNKLLPEGLKLSKANRDAIEEFLDFRKIIEENIDNALSDISFDREESGRTFTRNNGAYIAEDFSRAPLHYLRDKVTGKLPPNLITAIAAESLTWMGTVGKDTVWSDKDTLARLLGLDKDFDVTLEAQKALQDKGTTRSLFARSLGKNVARHLNLTSKKDATTVVDGLFLNRFETSIGLIATEALLRSDLLVPSNVPLEHYQHYQKGQKGKKEPIPPLSGKQVVLLRVPTQKSTKSSFPVARNDIEKFSDVYKGMGPILTKVLDVQARERRPLGEGELERANTVKRSIDRSLGRVDDVTAENIKKIQNQEISFNPVVVDLVNSFEEDAFMKEIMEMKELKDVLAVNVDSQKGKNIALKREYDSFKEGIAEHGNGVLKFLFSVKRNGRSMIDSSGLNYQSGKGLNRVALYDKTWDHEIGTQDLLQFNKAIDAGDYTQIPESLQEVLSATAFALGIKDRHGQGVDKTVEDAEWYQDVWEAVNDGVFKEAIDELRKPRAKDQKFTGEQTSLLGKATQKGGERTWSLYALANLADLQNALAEVGKGGTVTWTNRMPTEVDGLTNGLSLLSLELPSIVAPAYLDGKDPEDLAHQQAVEDHQRKMHNRTGIMWNDQAETTVGELIRNSDTANPFNDFYQELAVRTDNMVNGIISGTVDLNDPQYEILEMQPPKQGGDLLTQDQIALFARGVKSFSAKDKNGQPLDVAFMGDLTDGNGSATKFGRNMMKDPVMTSGVYGAGGRSVRGQIGISSNYDTAPAEQFYKKMEELLNDKTMSEHSKAVVVHGMISLLASAVSGKFETTGDKVANIRQKTKYYLYQGKMVVPTVKQIKTEFAKEASEGRTPVDEFIRRYEISNKGEHGFASPLTVLENRTMASFGIAAYHELSSNDMLGRQHKIRDDLLTAMQTVAKAAEIMYRKRLVAFVNDKNRAPTDDEERQIQQDLVKEGWGANFRGVHSKESNYSTYMQFGADKEVDLEEFYTDLLGKSEEGAENSDRKRLLESTKTQLGVAGGSKTGAASHTVNTVRRIPWAENIGVAGFVRTIQSMDGAIIAEIFKKHNIFHIFDAYMTGTNNIKEVGIDAQKAFIDIAKRYSIVDAVYSRYDEIAQKIEESNILSENDKAEILNFPFRNDDDPQGMREIFEESKEYQAEQIPKVREEFWKKIAAVNQFSKPNSPYMLNPNNKVSTDNEVFSGNYEFNFNENLKQKYSSPLLQDTFRTVMADMRNLAGEPALNSEHQEQIDKLSEFVIEPGLVHLDNVIFKATRNPDGTINKGKMKAAGLQPKVIEMEASGNQRTSPIQLSAQETAAHEMVHAVTFAFLEDPKSHWGRNEAQKLFDKAKSSLSWTAFLPDKDSYTRVEEEIARDRWQYIFENPEGNQLHEFVAIGLTNQQFAEALKDVPYTFKNETLETLKDPGVWKSDFLGQLWNVLAAALEWLVGGANKFKGDASDLHSSLFNLARKATALGAQQEAKTQSRLYRAFNEGWADRVDRANEKVKGLGRRAVMQWGSKRFKGKSQEEVNRYFKLTKRNLREGVRKMRQMLTEDLEKNGIGPKDFEMGRNLVQELKGLPREARKRWRNIRRKATTHIDNLRNRISNTVQSQVSDAFGRKLSRKERKALNDVFLRNDLSALLERFDFNEIMGFIQNPESLRTVVRELTDTLRRDYGRNGVAYTHQAKNLGLVISQGELLQNVLMPQMNAHNIANLMMFSEGDREPSGDLEAAEKMIDQLASLHALQYTDSSLKNDLSHLLTDENAREDSNGFTTYMMMHLAFKEMALEKNFDGNKIGTFKGYNEETYNQDIKIEYKPITKEWQDKMRKDGYELVGQVSRDPIHQKVSQDKRPRGIYVNSVGLGRYRAGPVSLTNPQAKGSDIVSELTESMGMLGAQRATKELAAVAKQARKGALRQFQEDLDTETRNQATLVPILSQKTGSITNMRYLMSDANKQKLLKREDFGDTNLGRMFGKIHDKENSKEINREVIRSAHTEWLNLRDDKRTKFRYIGLDAKNQNEIDAFRMLPTDMQNYAKHTFGSPGMYVREEYFNYIMGFREVSIAEKLHGLEKKYNEKNSRDLKIPLNVWKSIRLAEDIWTEIIEAVKIKGSVLLPDVVVGNIFSNVLVLAADGIPPNFIFSKAAEGLHAMKQYESKRLERDKLEVEIRSKQTQGIDTRKLEAQRAKLERDLVVNPVHEMIEEGLFQVITEDIGKESFETVPTHKPIRKAFYGLGEKFEELSPKGSGTVTAIKEFTLMPGSTLFGKIMKANQYGDFVARYVKYRYDMDVRKKDKQTAIDESMDYFIYYDEPSDPYISAINDYGVFMYWKFYARIQRVALRLFLDKPASMLGAAIADNYIMDTDEGIHNYLFNFNRAWDRAKIIPTPIENISKATDQPILDWAAWIIPGYAR